MVSIMSFFLFLFIVIIFIGFIVYVLPLFVFALPYTPILLAIIVAVILINDAGQRSDVFGGIELIGAMVCLVFSGHQVMLLFQNAKEI